MANIVEAYLQRLHSRLRRKLPEAEAHEFVKEISSHLRDCILERIRRGESEQSAALAALRAIGSDRAVADSLLRARSGIDERSVWQTAWPAGLAIVGYCFVFLGTENDLLDSHFSFYLSWIATAFTVLFAMICWRSRRLLWKPILATIAMVSAVVFTSQVVFEKQDLARTVSKMDRMITLAKTQITQAEAATAGRPSGAFEALGAGYYSAPKLNPINMVHYVNWTPILVRDGKRLVYQPSVVASKEEAQRLWHANGAAYVKSLRVGLEDFIVNRNRLARERPNLSSALALAKDTQIGAIGFFFTLMVLNCLILLASILFRSATSRLWRPERDFPIPSG